jgi:hypothetical protein
MPDQDSSLDLRLTPDWLKDSEPANRYADFDGEESFSFRHRNQRQSGARRRNPDPRRNPDQRSKPGHPRGNDSSNRKSGPRPNGAGGQHPNRHRSDDSSRHQERNRRSDKPRHRRNSSEMPLEIEPAAVHIDFLPEERAFTKIIQQIKQGHIAYPLFGLARMFLERPERHRVRIRSVDNSTMIYQLGDSGRVAMTPSALERTAFTETKDQFYETITVEKEPIKGNFTSVARCTFSGKLLGPTNYHTFQSAIRSLYEQRFSKRMTFDDYRRTIEISTNEETINQWKEEARLITTYRTKTEEPQETFDTLNAVEQHFRSRYLSTVVKPCLATEIPGEITRHLPDRNIIASIRKARDNENRFPAQIAGALRHGLNQAGLHVFKHKKRILYISAIRPQLFDPNQAALSSDPSAILAALRSYPKITRKQLAEKVIAKLLGENAAQENEEQYQKAKTNLATDLIWLAKAGHVIEFSDGTLDLPLPPKAPETPKPAGPELAKPIPSPLLSQTGNEQDPKPEVGLIETTEPSAVLLEEPGTLLKEELATIETDITHPETTMQEPDLAHFSEPPHSTESHPTE